MLANIDHDAVLQRNYATNWTILPNIGLDVIATALMKMMPAGAVPRTTIILIFAVQYSGILYFNRVLNGRISPLVAMLVVPLLYSFILNWGFTNFLLGLGLTFWAAGWWLAQRHRLAVALPVACLLATLIFFVHGLTFALYGVLVAMLEIGIWWQAPQRKVPALAGRLLPLLVQAVVPVLLFISAKTSQSRQGITNADDAIVRLASAGKLSARLWTLFQHRMVTIVRVAEGPSLAFDIAALAAMVVLLVLLIRRRRLVIARIAVPALLVFALFVIIVPPAMFGIGYVADRMPLMLAMLFVGTLDLRRHHDAFEAAVLAGVATIVALRLASIALLWQGYGVDRRDFDAVAALLPRGALVETIAVGGDRLDYSRRRCQMFGPLLIVEHGAVGRLFASEAAQPLRLSGPLLATVERVPRPTPDGRRQPDFADKLVDVANRAGFPWLFLCDGDRLTRPLPGNAITVAAAGRFRLVRLQPAPSQDMAR